MLAHDKIFKLALLALGKAQQLHRNSYISYSEYIICPLE